MRTAYSGIVRDSMDFSTAILDHRGQTLAQGLTTPMHLGVLLRCHVRPGAPLQARMAPGDVYIFNDPYARRTASICRTSTSVKPIYPRGSASAGWACSLAHHSDVGGIVAGSNATRRLTRSTRKACAFPIVKFVDAGKAVQGDLGHGGRTNVRLPDKVMGDLQSQLAACATGERELIDLVSALWRL